VKTFIANYDAENANRFRNGWCNEGLSRKSGSRNLLRFRMHRSVNG